MTRLRPRLAATVSILALLLSILATPAAQAAGEPLVLRYVTDASHLDVNLPLVGPASVDIDWGDSNSSHVELANGEKLFKKHTYASAGTREVSITGTLAGLGRSMDNFPYSWWGYVPMDYADRLTAVVSWGDVGLQSLYGAFADATNLVDVPNSIPSAVYETSFAFANATSINDPDISAWDVSNVQFMQHMFNGASSFNQNLNGWNTAQLRVMFGIFSRASAYNQPMSNWDVSRITSFSQVFSDATNFDQPLNNWDVSNSMDFYAMFQSTSFNRPLDQWDVSKSQTFTNMFLGSDFDQPLNMWDVSSGTYFNWMFASSPFNRPLSNWDMSGALYLGGMFYDTPFDQDITNWDVSTVTSFDYMFSNTPFNRDISVWDVSAGIYFSSMFYNNRVFDFDISDWNLQSALDLSSMFSYTNYNQPIENLDVSHVQNFNWMFASNGAFNRPIGVWDTSSAKYMSGMFYNSIFNRDISDWDTSNVLDTSYMFYISHVFNQPLNNWDMHNVSTMSYMFYGTTVFNQPLDNWDTSSLTNAYSMFSSATAFNQDISTWNVSSLVDTRYMFANATKFNQPIGVWNTASLQKAHDMFAGATDFNQSLGGWDVTNVLSDYNETYMYWLNPPVWDVRNGFGNLLDNTAISKANYTDTLTGWVENLSGEPNSGVKLNVGTTKYGCAAVDARATIVDTWGWELTDGGLSCKLDQTIDFPQPSDVDGNTGVQLAATATSGLAVTFTVTSGPCNIDEDNVVTATADGECDITASQAGDETWEAATDVTVTINATAPELLSQEITFDQPADMYVYSTNELSASSTSGLGITFTVISGDCSITEGGLQVNSAGECVVEASQAGDGTYNAATSVRRTITVIKHSQHITFPALIDLKVGESQQLAAYSDQENSVTYSVSGQCSLSGVTITATSAGSCLVTANADASDYWYAADPVDRSFNITTDNVTPPPAEKLIQEIQLNFPKQMQLSQTINLQAVSSANLKVSFAVEAGPCKIVDDVLSATNVGMCQLIASQPGNSSYKPATSVKFTIEIIEDRVDEPLTKMVQRIAKIYFSAKNYVLDVRAQRMLKNIVNHLNAQPTKKIEVRIKGWVQPTKNKRQDVRLSKLRAFIVAKKLRGLGVRGHYRVIPAGAREALGAKSRVTTVRLRYWVSTTRG